MTGREWQPGDVALVECSDGEWRQATCEPHPNYTGMLVWRFPDRVYRHVNDSAARPLVVIDPESPDDLDRLCKVLVEKMYAAGDAASAANGVHPSTMAAALRKFATPKPEEPTGLGAVVEARCRCRGDAIRFVRNDDVYPNDPWEAICGSHVYADLNAVRVLSEGVQP